MNILIIGGQGFVGQYLVKELCNDSKNKLTIVSRNTHPKQHVPIGSSKKVNVFDGFDIQDYKKIVRYFKNQDVVFNLAGLISFRQKDKSKLIDINHLGALNVLKACETMNVKKLIHLSSTAALGFSNSIINESYEFDWSKNKKCVYSVSKSLSNNQIENSKCNSVIVFPSLILGPGDKHNTFRLIDAIYKRKIPFSPPGRNSIVDVRDLAKALVLLMQSKNKHSRYIISGGSYSFKEINRKIAECIGVKPPKYEMPKFLLSPLTILAHILEIFSKNPPITYENIYMSFKDRNHSSSRIKEIGFRFQHTLEQTIIDSIEWVNTLK